MGGRVYLVLLILILIHSHLSAASLRGVVYDSETRESVAGANIRYTDGEAITETVYNGSFEVTQLDIGTYAFLITHVAYHTQKVEIRLSEDENKSIAVYLKRKAIVASPIVVAAEHTHTKFEEIAEVSSTVKGRQLQRQLDQTLASTLKDEAGLAMRSMGPAPARPVIRGLGGDRVQITEDGCKNTDLSSTSPDHAVTIEPFSLERIEVTRGPKALLETSSTMGGVVNAVRHEIPMEKPIAVFGNIGFFAESANNGSLGHANIEAPIGPLAAKAQFNRKSSSDLDTPIGLLDNSYSDNTDWNISSSYIHERGMIGYSHHSYDLDYGIPGGFVGGHEKGVDIAMTKRRDSYRARFVPQCECLRSFDVNLTRVYYRHKEFESADLIGSEFEVIDWIAEITTYYNDFLIFSEGTIGVTGEYRDFDIGGYVFNPPTISRNFAGFFHGSLSRGRFGLETAIRYEHGVVDPAYEKPDSRIGAIRKRNFNILALSTSALYEPVDDLAVGINLSRSARVPTTEELFSEGPHLAAYSYEIGNPDLESESGYGIEVFTYHRSDRATAITNAFYYDLSNYIIPRNTGEINYATFLPIYASNGVDARLYGFEAQLDLNLISHFKLSLSSSYTRGEFKESDSPLPQIPPLKGSIELAFENTRWNSGLRSQLVGDQNHVDEFEEPTAGYTTFNWYLQYTGQHAGLTHTVSLSVDNILDEEYRNHLSRIKSIMPEAGRSIRLTYRTFFEL